jgi:hypothetical protein
VDPTVQHVARVSQKIFFFFFRVDFKNYGEGKTAGGFHPQNKTKGRNKTKIEQRFFPAGGCAPYWIVVTVQHPHPWLSLCAIDFLSPSFPWAPSSPPPLSLPFFPPLSPVSLVVGGSSGVVVTLERPGMKEENKHNFNRIFSAKQKQTNQI